jgi:hypothetical protein
LHVLGHGRRRHPRGERTQLGGRDRGVLRDLVGDALLLVGGEVLEVVLQGGDVTFQFA